LAIGEGFGFAALLRPARADLQILQKLLQPRRGQ